MSVLQKQEFGGERYFRQDWQEDDLAQILDHLPDRPYSANWSEMGCFKTTTGLWLLDAVTSAAGNSLIVTTKSGKGTYYDAIPKSLDDNYRVYNVTTKSAAQIYHELTIDMDLDDFMMRVMHPTQSNIVIAHYNVFTNQSMMGKLLRKLDWEFVLVDEAHRIKNKDTQWTRNMKQLNARYRHIMTGTGFINNPAEIWSLLHFLDRQRFSSYWRFRRHYCDEVNIFGFDKIIGIKEETREEFRQLRQELGPRRLMSKVHSGILEPIFTPVVVELNPTQRKMYNEIRRELLTMDRNGVPIHSPNVLSQLSRLRQICVATPELVEDYFDYKLDRRVQKVKLTEPSSKLDATMEILEGLEWDDENRQQVVIFSNFKDPLELLKVRLDKANISYIHMEEKDSDATRYEKWHDLFPKQTHQVFLSTLQLGSESINLSSAHYAIFLDRSWSPKDNNQGVARIYRPGQTGQANIIHINAVKTTDQRVEKANEIKGSWFDAIFGDEDE